MHHLFHTDKQPHCNLCGRFAAKEMDVDGKWTGWWILKCVFKTDEGYEHS